MLECVAITPLAFAARMVRALEHFNLQRTEALQQWTRLAQAVFGMTAEALTSNIDVETSHTSGRCDSLGSDYDDRGVNFSADVEAGLPAFRTPPGLQPSERYHRIPKHEWGKLDKRLQERMYYLGRARRQRERRARNSKNKRCAAATQYAPYQ